VLALFLRAPAVKMPIKRKRVNLPQTRLDYTPRQMVRQPVFWVMYLAFVMVASGGLMAAAQIAPIAKDFKIAGTPVSLLGLQMAALTFAISLDRIFDGFGRPFFGWVSDHIGREFTMGIAFTIAAAALLALANFGSEPIAFVLLSALFFGVFGEIYSLFPATCGDTFGTKYAATNAGMLYTAKGTGSLLVPVASVLAAANGWMMVFMIAVAFNLCAALLALFVIRPLRYRLIAQNQEPVPAGAVDVSRIEGLRT